MIPGDIIFCHGSGIVARAIRLGERLRRKRGSNWNHVAVAYRYVNGQWEIIAAEGKGVSISPLSSLGTDYEVVSPPVGVDRAELVEFMRAQVGAKYGWLTIASIVVTLLTPLFFNVMAPGSWICSAVAGEALRFGGWLHSWPDVYQVTPADLYDALS